MAFTHIPGHQHVAEYGIVRHDGVIPARQASPPGRNGSGHSLFFPQIPSIWHPGNHRPASRVRPAGHTWDAPWAEALSERNRHRHLPVRHSRTALHPWHPLILLSSTTPFQAFSAAARKGAPEENPLQPRPHTGGRFQNPGNGHMMPGPGGKRAPDASRTVSPSCPGRIIEVFPGSGKGKCFPRDRILPEEESPSGLIQSSHVISRKRTMCPLAQVARPRQEGKSGPCYAAR